MNWQLIIFDCDGVLVNSEPISNRVMAEVLTENGLPMSLKICYEHFMGRNMSDCVRRFAPDLAATIERIRRRSRATLRISRLRSGQRWCEDVMPKREIILARALSLA